MTMGPQLVSIVTRHVVFSASDGLGGLGNCWGLLGLGGGAVHCSPAPVLPPVGGAVTVTEGVVGVGVGEPAVDVPPLLALSSELLPTRYAMAAKPMTTATTTAATMMTVPVLFL